MKLTIAASLLLLDSYVSAHGYVQQIALGSNLVNAWNPYKDPQRKPPPSVITRHFLDNGPVTDGMFTVRLRDAPAPLALEPPPAVLAFDLSKS